jgi:hypothetical protein
VRWDHEEREVVLIAPGNENGVVADREGVDMDDAVVDEQSSWQRVPGSDVQADARDRPEVLGQCGDQGGKLGCNVTGSRPPRPVENAPAVVRGLQPYDSRPGLHHLVDGVRQEPGHPRGAGVGHDTRLSARDTE